MIIRLAREGFAFVRENDLQTIVREFSRRDTHPFLQFLKYGICGVIATVTMVAFFYLFSFIFPSGTDLNLTKNERAVNHGLANLCAFPFSNAVAYALNALWVFQGGRHSRVREFLYFTAVSLISFVGGLLGGPLLIQLYGDAVSHHVAEAGFVVSAALVNFVCRKFLIFAG